MRILRWLISLAVLFALLCAGASWWIGREIESQVRQGHADLSDALGLPVQLQNYRRGWFSSSATSQIRLGDELDAPVLNVQHRIFHGPLPQWRSLGLVSAISEVTLTPAASSQSGTADTSAAPLRIESDLGLDRHVRLVLTGQPSRFTTANGAQWSLAALNGRLELAPQMRAISAQLDWDGMQWTGQNNARLRIGKVVLNGSYQIPAGRTSVYDGQSALSVDHLELRNLFAADLQQQPVPYDWQFNGIQWANRLNTQSALGEASASLQATAMQLDGQALGPAQWAMSLNNIPVEPLERVMPKLDAWLKQQSPQPNAQGEQLSLTEQQAIQNDIAALFNQGLRLQLDRWSISLPVGEVLVTGQMDAPELSGTDLSFLPMSLASKVNATVQARVPPSVAMDVQGAATFEALRAQGLWRADGDAVAATLEYQRGLSTINGQAVEPASLARWFGQ